MPENKKPKDILNWFREPPVESDWFVQWFIASCGVATFFLAYGGVQFLNARVTISLIVGFLYILGFFSIGLGLLLVWRKRPPYGRPIRLFLSGVALPAFIFLVARVVSIGMF